jgi:lysophospholipase L1-like esterase
MQQASLVEAVGTRFVNDRRVRHVSVAGEVDVRDPEFSFDGVHLTARGNQRAGEHLVDAIFQLLQEP